jgi:hypothetical protein
MTLALHMNNVSYAGIVQPGGYGTLPASLALNTTDNITWTVTFVGNTEVGFDGLASLKDGVYVLNINGTKVHPAGLPLVNMAASTTTTFHRLYGDTNLPTVAGADFSAVLNSADNLQFRNGFNKPAGGGYIPYLDFNGDGIINSGDNLQFRTRFNRPLTWTV